MANRALLDVDICLDAMLDRPPFSDSALLILQAVERKKIIGVLSAISFDTIYYLLRPKMGATSANARIKELSRHIHIGTVTETTVRKAIEAGWNDLEDALQYYTAVENKCDLLVTRNIRDYKPDKIPVVIPDEFLTTYLT